jgi:hypothetical protein
MAHCNQVYVKCNKHAYNILLNVNENMKNLLNGEEVLCLDGIRYDNVNRFLNQQCHDANLLNIPIQIGTNAKNLYHVRC